MTMTISKQQDDHQHHHGHDQHRNNHINNNNSNNNVEYSLEKNKDCTSTTTNTRPESIFHQKKMIQQSSSSRSLPPNFEIPKTLMSNDSIDIGNDNTNYNDSEKSIKFLRGLYSTLPEIKEKRQRRDTKRTTTTTTCTTTATLIMNHDHDHEKLNDATDTNTISISVITGILKEIDRDSNSNKIGSDEDEYEEIMIVPIQYDNYVNKRHMLSKDITSIAGKRRNELLLDDASGIYEAVRAMKLESKLLSSGEEEDDDDDVTRA